MITIEKDGKVLRVTERAFKLVYKDNGFTLSEQQEKPEEELKNQEGEVIEGNEEVPTESEPKEETEDEPISIDKEKITVPEIEKLLDKYDIEYPAGAKREVKLDLLLTGLELKGLM